MGYRDRTSWAFFGLNMLSYMPTPSYLTKRMRKNQRQGLTNRGAEVERGYELAWASRPAHQCLSTCLRVGMTAGGCFCSALCLSMAASHNVSTWWCRSVILVFKDTYFSCNMVPKCKPTASSGAQPKKQQSVPMAEEKEIFGLTEKWYVDIECGTF